MKKILKATLLAMLTLVVAACGSDDDDYADAVNNSYVSYEITVDQQLLEYYDVQADYKGFDGESTVEPINSSTPDKKKFEKKHQDVGKISPRLRVYGFRKEGATVDQSKSYTLKSSYKIGCYSPTNTAKNYTGESAKSLTGEQMAKYVADNAELVILSYGD